MGWTGIIVVGVGVRVRIYRRDSVMGSSGGDGGDREGGTVVVVVI